MDWRQLMWCEIAVQRQRVRLQQRCEAAAACQRHPAVCYCPTETGNLPARTCNCLSWAQTLTQSRLQRASYCTHAAAAFSLVYWIASSWQGSSSLALVGQPAARQEDSVGHEGGDSQALDSQDKRAIPAFPPYRDWLAAGSCPLGIGVA